MPLPKAPRVIPTTARSSPQERRGLVEGLDEDPMGDDEGDSSASDDDDDDEGFGYSFGGLNQGRKDAPTRKRLTRSATAVRDAPGKAEKAAGGPTGREGVWAPTASTSAPSAAASAGKKRARDADDDYKPWAPPGGKAPAVPLTSSYRSVKSSNSGSDGVDKSKGKGKASAGASADEGKAAKAKAEALSPVVLSAEQERVRDLVVQDGVSLFYTGSAGTGKSVLLRELIVALRQKYSGQADAVAVTASTGIAACNIGGQTVHSWAGIRLGMEDLATYVRMIRNRVDLLERWSGVKVWIIDEVSMLDGGLFDKLSQIGSEVRHNGQPFGGIQLVVTGDFLQLPPITTFGREPCFAFEAECWPQAIKRQIELTQVFRQKDERFVRMLSELRFGVLSKETVKQFSGMHRAVEYDDGIEPTELFAKRDQVESANLKRLAAIKTEEVTFTADDYGSLQGEQRKKILSNMMAPKSLSIKVGAQVMLIRNTTRTLVNGSLGTVISLSDVKTYAETLFGPGGSREKASGPRYPLVKFAVSGGDFETLLVVPQRFDVEDSRGEVIAGRKQVPLILAWAISIHKSQGQTLQRMKCDLGQVFEKGQTYVALSRATSLETLQITNFKKTKVMAHAKVATWNKENLETLDLAAAASTASTSTGASKSA